MIPIALAAKRHIYIENLLPGPLSSTASPAYPKLLAGIKFPTTSIHKHSSMAARRASAILLLLITNLSSAALAKPMFHVFWPKVPSNSHYQGDVPDGEPATNDAFWEMLVSESSDHSRSQSHSIGDEGSTWWFAARLEEDLVEEKYKKLKLASTQSNNPRPGSSKLTMRPGWCHRQHRSRRWRGGFSNAHRQTTQNFYETCT